MKLCGPYSFDCILYLTDGEQVGEALLVVVADKTLQEQAGDGWRLCDKREFFNELTAEVTGVNTEFALPGGPEWDDPASD